MQHTARQFLDSGYLRCAPTNPYRVPSSVLQKVNENDVSCLELLNLQTTFHSAPTSHRNTAYNKLHAITMLYYTRKHAHCIALASRGDLLHAASAIAGRPRRRLKLLLERCDLPN